MYKQKLQVLCQQRQWALPLYTSAKDGPDHIPRFWASVTVNGATFDSPQDPPSRTSKEAQNEAARVALHHFAPSSAPSAAAPPPAAVAAAPPPPQPLAQPSCSLSARTEVDDKPARNEDLKGHGSEVNGLNMDAREMQYLYKVQLQIYAQKRNLNLPTYEYVREGSVYARRVKALVTVDGKTFEGPQFFSTMKEAENAAAKVALSSLSTVGNQEEDYGFYKNLLQELTQKEGLTIPTYGTVRDGPSHIPTFFSTVEIEGERFEGSAAKTKKQAEINAAKVAWTRLRERKLSRLPGGSLPRFQMLEINDVSPSLPSMDSQLPRTRQLPVLCTKPDKGYNAVTGDVGNSTAYVPKTNSTENRVQLGSPPSSDNVYARLRDPCLEEPVLSDDEVSSASFQPECLEFASTDKGSACPPGSGDSSLLCNRVRVFPRGPDFELPSGTKLLPFSDEMWVAVSVEPSREVAGYIPV